MKTSESWKTWLPLLGVLVIFGVLTAVWPVLANTFSLPSLSFGGGSSTPLPTVIEPISLEGMKNALAAGPLVSMAEALPDEISPFVALLVVAALVIGAIIVVGGGLAFIIKLLSGIRNTLFESKAFQEHQSALEQRSKEQLKHLQDGRTADDVPSHETPRWNIISNTLIALMFVGFASMVYVRSFFPEGYIVREDGFTSVTLPVFLILALITLLVIGLRLRSRKGAEVRNTDNGRLPWDFIAVLITGLIMLGLGIGFMAYINATGG